MPEAGGVYDMRARWWSPSLGVFLSIDDFEYCGRTGTLWSWPKQNPIRYSDPSGHTDREGNVDLKNLAGMSEGERRAVGVVSLLAVALAVGPGWVGVLAVGATVANHDEMGKFVFAVPAIAGAGKATEAVGVAREKPCPVEEAPPGSAGAAKRYNFDTETSAQRHAPGVSRPGSSAGPANGQDALDSSIGINSNTSRRVGIDYETGDYVVFDEHAPGEYHGHVRGWDDLTPGMQSALRKAGMADGRGRVLGGD